MHDANWIRRMARIIFLVLPAIIAIAAQAGLAHGHFFGATKNVDEYQVIFAPFPQVPDAGDNSTVLNFSVLENNENIYNIHAAVVITNGTGYVVEQVPYRFYEFSDITIPYTFQDNGNYEVTLQTRIAGDEKYEANPLQVSFEISVGNQPVPFEELMLFYVTPAAAVIAGIAIYLHSRKKL